MRPRVVRTAPQRGPLALPAAGRHNQMLIVSPRRCPTDVHQHLWPHTLVDALRARRPPGTAECGGRAARPPACAARGVGGRRFASSCGALLTSDCAEPPPGTQAGHAAGAVRDHRPLHPRASPTPCAASGCPPPLSGVCAPPPTASAFSSDPIARALRGGRTELVGVVGSLADLWHQQFVTSLQGSLRRHGLRMEP